MYNVIITKKASPSRNKFRPRVHRDRALCGSFAKTIHKRTQVHVEISTNTTEHIHNKFFFMIQHNILHHPQRTITFQMLTRAVTNNPGGPLACQWYILQCYWRAGGFLQTLRRTEYSAKFLLFTRQKVVFPLGPHIWTLCRHLNYSAVNPRPPPPRNNSKLCFDNLSPLKVFLLFLLK